ncbi:MAG: hypothetical protein JOZ70_07710 [Pseudolabrys sp.]|nr:hypothetical protein [Pseudolabrys sp.]MBV9955121.1 hypothetical protein [Pseudolabrys sp.]
MSAAVFEITPEQQEKLAAIDGKVVPARSCGTCSLCCKVVSIAEFQKPAGVWCSHAKPGKGCGIHLTRPFVCRGAYCEWMIAKGLGDEWKPEIAKFALFARENGNRLTAHVDPGNPAAWRREPYYRNFKDWALKGLLRRPHIQIIDVMVGEICTVVLPDRDVTVGAIGQDEVLQFDHGAPGEVKAVRVVKRASLAAPAA